jgi:transcriptional regulator
MYVSPKNRIDDKSEILSFVKKYNFASLVSQVKGRLWGTHIPFMAIEQGEEIWLTAHISKGNPQWKEIENQEVMVIFNGPHAFISADWYDHENVSTWNYQSVHAYGKVTLLEGEDLFEIVKLLTSKYEHPTSSAHIDNMSPDYVAREMRGIIGVKIVVTEFIASYKLSQNRDNHNYEQIILRLEGLDEESKQVAAAMRKLVD